MSKNSHKKGMDLVHWSYNSHRDGTTTYQLVVSRTTLSRYILGRIYHFTHEWLEKHLPKSVTRLEWRGWRFWTKDFWSRHPEYFRLPLANHWDVECDHWNRGWQKRLYEIPVDLAFMEEHYPLQGYSWNKKGKSWAEEAQERLEWAQKRAGKTLLTPDLDVTFDGPG
jgi:hypothetical protein